MPLKCVKSVIYEVLVCEVCDMVVELVHEVLQLLTWYMGRCELANELRKPWSGTHGTCERWRRKLRRSQWYAWCVVR